MIFASRLFTWFIVALQAGAYVRATPAALQFEKPNTMRSVGTLSDDTLFAPGGEFPRSRVHAVPEGAHVAHIGNSIHTIASNGTTLSTTPFAQSNTGRTRGAGTPSRRSAQFKDGFIVTPDWHNTDPSPVASFSTTWNVPSIPETVDGQILYLFNSIEPNDFQSIIQPVLQFGTTPAGGGDFWAIASWFVIGSDVFYTPLTIVSPGQTLTGHITLVETMKDLDTGNATGFIYKSTFEGVPASELSMTVTAELTWLAESLEVHGATGPTEIPRGRTAMSAINVLNQNGQVPALSWTPCTFFGVTDTADGFGCAIVTDGGVNGEIDIIYPLQ